MGISICLKYIVDADLLRKKSDWKPDWEEYNPGGGATPKDVALSLERFNEAINEFNAKIEIDESKVDEDGNYVICEWYDDGCICKNFAKVNTILKEFVDNHYIVSFGDIRMVACLSD